MFLKNTYKYIKVFFAFVAVLLFASCNNNQQNEKLIIATAANMQFAMDTLIAEFNRTTGMKCQKVVNSSGNLTAQIKEGAPYDIFVSADMKYPMDLYKNGFSNHKPMVYALGNIILWTMYDDIDVEVQSLNDKRVKHIALPNPKIAPYGKAACEILEYYNIKDSVSDCLVYGESVAQTNQFITSKSAEIGFTAMSVVMSPQMKNKGKWMKINNDIFKPISQGVIIVERENSNTKASKKFYEFLFSKKAKDILKDFGYLVNE